jgi:SLT domain-containing protein
VTEHNLGSLGRSIESLTRSGGIDPEAGKVLYGYLAGGIDAFQTYRRLQEAGHSPQMAPRGSARWSTTSTSSWSDVSSARA